MARLPEFGYHPDPVATGAFERRSIECACCQRTSTWSYSIVPYARHNLRDRLCADCIADGSAAEKFQARFTVLDPATVPPGIDPAVIEELTTRTPGFAGWTQERWLFHCGDAAAFHGACGWEALEDLPELRQELLAETIRSGLELDDAEAFVGSLDVDGASTAYVFRCRHCHQWLAYTDSDPD